MSSRIPDVEVVGDGPAGSALAAALDRHGVDVVLVGPDRPWPATYGTWTDDLDGLAVLHGASDVWQFRTPSIRARFGRERTIERGYGVVDNAALREALRGGLHHRRSEVVDSNELAARIVVDATGWPSRLHPSHSKELGWQTAFGVVLPAPPDGPLGTATLMDFSDASSDANHDDVGVPTFAYALPVADGWMVEETVLTARPSIAPSRLVDRLAARLGRRREDLLADAIRTEEVAIPMGAPPAASIGNVMAYGAAAGMINPTTGYSLATSLGAASGVAERVAQALEAPGLIEPAVLDATVWPTASLRTRALHDYGLSVLERLDADGIRSFFDAFFDGPAAQWSSYLRVDAPPTDVARTMRAMFARASWPLRAELVRSNPRPLARVLRPRPRHRRRD